MASNSYSLLMQLGPKQGETVPVLGKEFSLGRDPKSDWSIEDIEVSRRHARLVQQEEGYAVEDLGSTNGTFVNGQRIRSVLPLLPGATIRLGENVLLFFDSKEAEEDEKAQETNTMEIEKEDEAPSSKPAPVEIIADDIEPEKVEQEPEKKVVEQEEPEAEAQEESEPEIQKIMPVPRRQSIKRPQWPLVGDQAGLGIVVIAIIGILALTVFLWYVDANFLWCDVFGNLIPACR